MNTRRDDVICIVPFQRGIYWSKRKLKEFIIKYIDHITKSDVSGDDGQSNREIFITRALPVIQNTPKREIAQLFWTGNIVNIFNSRHDPAAFWPTLCKIYADERDAITEKENTEPEPEKVEDAKPDVMKDLEKFIDTMFEGGLN